MRQSFVWIVAVAILFSARSAQAQLAYSFETGTPANPDGFTPNGGGIVLNQDVVGATNGVNSLHATVVNGATFVGALTTVIPNTPGGAVLNNPPGVNFITFDMTTSPVSSFAGSFAVVGITFFGATQPGPGQQFGLQAQFADFEHIGTKPAGSTTSVQIDLSSATNPITFQTGQSFNQIFGSGPNQLIPTGFQLFLNKSNDAPLSVYFDNIRVGIIPEPASCILVALGLGFVGFIRRRSR